MNSVSWESQCFPRRSRESQCFPRRGRGKHWDFQETKFTVPLGTSHKVFIVLWGKYFMVKHCTNKQDYLLYSWRFFHYGVPIYWLVHSHMASNNEAVSRQMPWAGNIVKTITSNGKQLPAKCWPLLYVVRACSYLLFGYLFSTGLTPFLLHNKWLNDWSLGEQWILFRAENLRVSRDEVEVNLISF